MTTYARFATGLDTWTLRCRAEYAILCAVKKILILAVLAVCGGAVADETDDGALWNAGASGGMFLPGGGNSLKRAAVVSVRAGRYLSDALAVEMEGGCVPKSSLSTGGHATVTAFAARGLFHLSGIEEFDMLFGCERFDPFATFGVAALFASHHAFADGSHRTGIGPSAGIGAYYHLTDSWSLRFDATAAMTADSRCGMAYGIGLGVQRTFGGGGL